MKKLPQTVLSETQLRQVSGGILPAIGIAAGTVVAGAYLTNYFTNRSDGHAKGLKNS